MSRISTMALLAALFTASCGELARDNPFDLKRCATSCGKGERCHAGACVKDPCPEGMIFVKKQMNANTVNQTNAKTDFCISKVEASRKKSSAAAASLDMGNTPWSGVMGDEAWAACRASGYTLCSYQQWAQGCEGFKAESYDNQQNQPDAAACTSASGGLRKTGSLPACEGGYTGLFDMFGNVSEWVSYLEKGNNIVSTHGLAGRTDQGGSSSCQDFQTDWGNMRQVDLANVGFRCCVPCDSGGTKCEAKREWFQYAIRSAKDNMNTILRAVDMWGNSATSIWMVSDSQVAHFDGKAWMVDQTWGTHSAITAITGLPGGDVYIAADGYVIHSNNGSPKKLGTGGWTLKEVADIQAVSGQSVYAVGSTNDHGKPTVWHWDGTTWTGVPGMVDNLNAAWYDRSTGSLWVAGDDGLIARLKGGVWDNKRIKQGQHLADIHGTGSGNILAVGKEVVTGGQDMALVLRYDGATWSWENTQAQGKSGLANVIALPGKRFWAAGDNLLSFDGSAMYTWHTGDYSPTVWVPDTNKPEEIWVGLTRRF